MVWSDLEDELRVKTRWAVADTEAQSELLVLNLMDFVLMDLELREEIDVAEESGRCRWRESRWRKALELVDELVSRELVRKWPWLDWDESISPRRCRDRLTRSSRPEKEGEGCKVEQLENERESAFVCAGLVG